MAYGSKKKMKILVRSRKDASAVKHAIERILDSKDHYEIVSLGGYRGEQLCKAVQEELEPFTIILLGRKEHEPCIESLTRNNPFTAYIMAKTSKLRNSTLEMIVSLLNWGRAHLRLSTSWYQDSFILANTPGTLLPQIPIHPEGDTYLMTKNGFRLLAELSGINDKTSYNKDGVAVMFKYTKGKHIVYFDEFRRIELTFERGKERPTIHNFTDKNNNRPNKNFVPVNLDRLLDHNSHVTKLLEGESLKILSKNTDKHSKVIVPLSGGKDSAAALIVASQYFDPSNIYAVYVDTGIDFVENEHYAEYLSERLGVNLVKTKADVDKGLLHENMPLPDPRYRWCTGRKLDALRRTVKRLINAENIRYIIVGDRDAESVRRSLRPPMRIDENLGLPVIAPLKYWSGAHVILYILSEGYRINALYEKGFLRLGCYICFALRPSWELYIMNKIKYFEKIRALRPEQTRLISAFLQAKQIELSQSING